MNNMSKTYLLALLALLSASPVLLAQTQAEQKQKQKKSKEKEFDIDQVDKVIKQAEKRQKKLAAETEKNSSETDTDEIAQFKKELGIGKRVRVLDELSTLAEKRVNRIKNINALREDMIKAYYARELKKLKEKEERHLELTKKEMEFRSDDTRLQDARILKEAAVPQKGKISDTDKLKHEKLISKQIPKQTKGLAEEKEILSFKDDTRIAKEVDEEVERFADKESITDMKRINKRYKKLMYEIKQNERELVKIDKRFKNRKQEEAEQAKRDAAKKKARAKKKKEEAAQRAAELEQVKQAQALLEKTKQEPDAPVAAGSIADEAMRENIQVPSAQDQEKLEEPEDSEQPKQTENKQNTSDPKAGS